MPDMADLLAAAQAHQNLTGRLGVGPESYNATESARAGVNIPELAGLTPEQLALVNRMADSGDLRTAFGAHSALTTAALPVYEGIKAIDQNFGTDIRGFLRGAGVGRVTPDNEKTTDASFANVAASLAGPGLALTSSLRSLLQ
jgi:hypothetical protein